MAENGSQGSRWPGFEALRREIDRAFEQVSGFPRAQPVPAAVPVDMIETGTGYEITVELPGIEPDAVELTVAGRVLTLTGDKTDADAARKPGAPIAERRFGPFSRAITLPAGADGGRAVASFAGGVLTIRIPRTVPTEPDTSRIPIRPG